MSNGRESAPLEGSDQPYGNRARRDANSDLQTRLSFRRPESIDLCHVAQDGGRGADRKLRRGIHCIENSEHRHDGIASNLVDDSTVLLDRIQHRRNVLV